MTTRVIVQPAEMRWQQLMILLGGRLVFNTAFRIIYPLLTFLAAGLGVNLGTASLLVTVQVGATLLSPLGGALSDARGERLTLTLGLVAYCLGALVCALAKGFGVFLAGYVLIGLGTALYMPAVQAYASARSAYSQRGRVLGILELSWALSALLGVAGLTQLVQAQGSWAPAFWVLFGIAALMLLLTITLPDQGGRGGQRARGEESETGAREGQTFQAVLAKPSVVGALALIFFQLLAAELVFVVYAGWLGRDFGASTEQLGLIFGLLGVVELAGSIGATLWTDRIGKRRAVLIGFAGVALFAALLPLSSGRWGLFLLLFLLFDLCFEFAIVSFLPLVSGLTTHGRGTVLALSVASMGLGRIVGSLLGPRMFEATGFVANGLLASAAALIGIVVGLWFVREGRE